MRIDQYERFEKIDGLTAAGVPTPKPEAKLKMLGLAGRIVLVVTVAVLAIGNSLSFSNPTLFLMIFSSLLI